MNEQADPAAIESAWRQIASELERAKDRLYAAIRDYPPPITACDEQFDRLLRQRETVSRELERARKASAASRDDRDPAARIEEFLHTSSVIGEEAQRHIKALRKSN